MPHAQVGEGDYTRKLRAILIRKMEVLDTCLAGLPGNTEPLLEHRPALNAPLRRLLRLPR